MIGIQILVEEHENIFNFTNIVEKKMVEIMDGAAVDTAYFRKCIRFIREYADEHHHRKEEGILFETMVEELGNLAEILIRNGMMVEHDQARYFTTEWENALNAYDESPETIHKLNILTFGMSYVHLLRKHATKENNVLYPFAENKLSEEAKQIVNDETERLEREKADFSEFEEFFVSK